MTQLSLFDVEPEPAPVAEPDPETLSAAHFEAAKDLEFGEEALRLARLWEWDVEYMKDWNAVQIMQKGPTK